MNKSLKKLLITGDLGILLDFWIKILRKCSEIKVRCVFQWFINTSQLKISPALIFEVADIILNLQIFGACGGLRRHKDTNLHQPFNVHEPLDVSVRRLLFIETHFKFPFFSRISIFVSYFRCFWKTFKKYGMSLEIVTMEKNNELAELFNKHGSNKFEHCYSDIYFLYLEKLKTKKMDTIHQPP